MKTKARKRPKQPSHAMFKQEIQESAILEALFSWLLLNFITICAHVTLLIMWTSFALVSWVAACYLWHMLKTGEFVTWLPPSARGYFRNAVVHETLCNKGLKGANKSYGVQSRFERREHKNNKVGLYSQE